LIALLLTNRIVSFRLSEQLMKVTDKAPESWISIGYYSLISRKIARTRTVYFAQKVCTLD
jgi:hypothetical protein